MKASVLLSTTLMGLASAVPMTFDLSEDMIEKLKTGKSAGTVSIAATGVTANEFLDSGCRDVIFLYARGSNQDGNIGGSPGPQTIDALKAALGSGRVAAQGIEYPASLLDNIRPQGCDPADAEDFKDLITKAATDCPNSKLVLSGYSQGAALVHAAAKMLSASVASKVAAAVTYGDTRKKQDGGVVPNIDPSRSLILCHDGDLVCSGTLIVTDNHYDYDDLAGTAVSFIASKV
ncbi:carbohydrate esterase family 5 protein [Xylaria bambusicola]|uniref:carbohydrate esterase family 5 protein n=1 Tax=Xylaria bambusicola TaxID=326684 RepID=UPI00200744D9|nr:carbohydrate esterase family 5 protein [Xylaria bambusicola]KAI0521704.1 carbohydrate esterase family 5 protein [Xylaria bambusicola]